MEVSLAKADRKLGSLLFEGSLGLLYDCGESGSVNDCEIGKDFAIELNVSGLQAFDEAGVGHSFVSDGSGNTLNPEAAELPLTLLAVAILVLTGFVDGVLCVAVKLGTEASESFGAEEDTLAAFPAGRTVSCSWHGFFWMSGSLGFNFTPIVSLARGPSEEGWLSRGRPFCRRGHRARMHGKTYFMRRFLFTFVMSASETSVALPRFLFRFRFFFWRM